MIIAVDFDDTLQLPDGTPNLTLIARLRASQRRGDIVILWTCREGPGLQEALTFLRRHGFVPNLANQNAPQAIRLLGHDSRKILADVYIDDKNATR